MSEIQKFNAQDFKKPVPNLTVLKGMGEMVKASIAEAMPGFMKAQATPLLRALYTECQKQPALLSCTPESLFGALIQAAQMGLQLGGALGQCYMIPFKGRVTLVPGYRGLIQLVNRSGQAGVISARTVYDKDEFEVVYGTEDKIVHRPGSYPFAADVAKRKSVAFYATCKTRHGSPFVMMTRAEAEVHRDRFALSKRGGPWVDHFDSMSMKGLALDTPLVTPEGWVSMGDVQQGDEVIDMDGNPTTVLAVSEVKNLNCYKVTFGDGTSIVCDDEHYWWARVGQHHGTPFKARQVKELLDAKEKGLAVTVPVAAAIDLPDADLPLHPYVLGVWLGNGTSRGASISVHCDDLDAFLQMFTDAEVNIGSVLRDQRSKAVVINLRGIREVLASMGLLNNKHVPAAYLRGSFRQRLELLRGLMDTDGSASRNRAIFTNTNKKLSDSVAELACSLGETVTRAEVTRHGFGLTVLSYDVTWTPGICPFWLLRKAAKTPGRQVPHYRTVRSIDPVPSVPTKCIFVDSPTASYLAGERMIPTHNTCIIKLCKMLPMSAEMQMATSLDDAADNGEPIDCSFLFSGQVQDDGDVVDAPPPQDQVEALRQKLTPRQSEGETAAHSTTNGHKLNPVAELYEQYLAAGGNSNELLSKLDATVEDLENSMGGRADKYKVAIRKAIAELQKP